MKPIVIKVSLSCVLFRSGPVVNFPLIVFVCSVTGDRCMPGMFALLSPERLLVVLQAIIVGHSWKARLQLRQVS